jgi:hypothetical protein
MRAQTDLPLLWMEMLESALRSVEASLRQMVVRFEVECGRVEETLVGGREEDASWLFSVPCFELRESAILREVSDGIDLGPHRPHQRPKSVFLRVLEMAEARRDAALQLLHDSALAEERESRWLGDVHRRDEVAKRARVWQERVVALLEHGPASSVWPGWPWTEFQRHLRAHNNEVERHMEMDIARQAMRMVWRWRHGLDDLVIPGRQLPGTVVVVAGRNTIQACSSRWQDQYEEVHVGDFWHLEWDSAATPEPEDDPPLPALLNALNF